MKLPVIGIPASGGNKEKMMKFKRENRCIVFLHKDCEAYLSKSEKEYLNRICKSINFGRAAVEDKGELEGVFIKSTWDVYDEAWALVEKQWELDKERK